MTADEFKLIHERALMAAHTRLIGYGDSIDECVSAYRKSVLTQIVERASER